ncbi:MAG: carbonic anhydrase [Nanoarchaeota archaeon]
MILPVKEPIVPYLKGNRNYAAAAGKTLQRCLEGQHPPVTCVSCCDSRVVPHEIFQVSGPEQLFKIDVIGNQVAVAQGSVDYGVLHLHTPLLFIIGHTGCGAIKAASGDFSQENQEIQKELRPLVDAIDDEGRSPHDLTRFAQNNVDRQVAIARKRYGDKAFIIGLMFDLHNHYGGGNGRVYIVNMNGDTDIDGIQNHPLLCDFHEVAKRL